MKNNIFTLLIILAIIAFFTSMVSYSQEGPSDIEPFYNYELFINKDPFAVAVSMKYIVPNTADYSFFISDHDYLNFHPSLNVRDFSAISGKSRALITQQETRDDIIKWTIFEVPQESELLINYRIVPNDIFHMERPLRSFWDGARGLLFFATTLMKPVGYEDSSIQIQLNSKDIDFHRPFSMGTLRKDLYYSSSIDELSQLIIPIGNWHKIENFTDQSIVNIYLDPGIPRNLLNNLNRELQNYMSSRAFTDMIANLSGDRGIMSQFIILFYDEDEPGIVDMPVMYYNNYCFLFIPKIGDYIKDLQVLINRELLRQTIKLYIASLSIQNLTEFSPVNGLLTYISVHSLYNSRILDKNYFNRFRRMTFLKYPYNLRDYEYSNIDLKVLDPRIYYVPGIIDNRANMFSKIFFALGLSNLKINWNEFMLKFIEVYEDGIPYNKGIMDIITEVLPEGDPDIISNIYNIIKVYETNIDRLDS